MDVFANLVATYEAVGLDDGTAIDLRAVARAISALAPSLERMRLRQPDPELLARIKLAAAS